MMKNDKKQEINSLWFKSLYFQCLKISKEIKYLKKYEGIKKDFDIVILNIKEALIWKLGLYLRTLVEYIIKNEFESFESRKIREIIYKLISNNIISWKQNNLINYLKYFKQNLDYYFAHLRHPNYEKINYDYSIDIINNNIKIWIEYIFSETVYKYVFEKITINYQDINILWLELIISSLKNNK